LRIQRAVCGSGNLTNKVKFLNAYSSCKKAAKNATKKLRLAAAKFDKKLQIFIKIKIKSCENLIYFVKFLGASPFYSNKNLKKL
jgi:hypothetical protein